MKTIFTDICSDFEAELVEIDGESDHVYLLVRYLPKTFVAPLVNSLKGVSSRLLRKDHRDSANTTGELPYGRRVIFPRPCGGAPLDIIKQYIEQQ